MAVKISQQMKQTQALTMTPQLQQAIKLLTLTHLEMVNVISDEMVENPLLEEFGNSADSEAKKNEEDYKVERLEMQNKEASAENFEDKGIGKQEDFDWNNYVEQFNSNNYQTPGSVGVDPDEIPNYENIVTSSASLPDHLEWQLRMENLTEEEWKVARLIIGNIENSGYLSVNFEDIISETGHDREDAFEILKMIQKLDPVGCGASNLTECLLIQAEVLDERSPLIETIIRDHLPDLQKRDYDSIIKVTGVTKERIKEVELIIQSFHPRPGHLVASDETHYVVPDIYVIEVGGEFVVQVNDEGVPRLRISQLYQSMLKKGESKGELEAKEYVQDKLRSAMWLIKSIQNRQRTIDKVAKAIVRQQQLFFKKGPEHLKPMVLKDIAEEIGMHESTVSRVTTNKYMHTPIGLFELKYFFNTGIGGKSGGIDISSEVLKIKLKQLIENENPQKPFSDQKIADILSQSDVKVARRTVAKYRELLGIASSSQRRLKK